MYLSSSDYGRVFIVSYVVFSLQILMSVSVMENVSSCAITPLAASTAAVGQVINLTKMGSTAPVNSKQL